MFQILVWFRSCALNIQQKNGNVDLPFEIC